ncbi:dol-P-Man:Man(5)GlcNAc(2)-PP-Dol alpha-1,3-mannosyltransferase [[Candida] anglica]|uniref:Dol-P-Man:Man(5)GlcNAc(2)-PP-Dol alpha-1,3-mannosyltransferase n=1 Tax=[Candida] anglica TaxID=148631 RepID=A0ABP0EAT0_9ASCO
MSSKEEKAPLSDKETTTTDPTTVAEPELPEFNLKNVSMDIYNGAIALVVDPQAVKVIAPLVVVLTSAICKVIVHKVAYTEIDFSTYMQQIELINEGELDYSQIFGDSGPIVYPAGFVQVYQTLYSITKGGKDLGSAQLIFGYLLALTNLLAAIVYTTAASVQPWTLYLLLASKRIYSIYVLRLFNDCFATICMAGVILLLQQASYWRSTTSSTVSYVLCLVAADLFSLAISVKMNALLYLPGFLVVAYFLCGENLLKLFTVLLVFPFVQVTIGWKFILPLFNDEDAQMIRYNYFTQAFDFSRKFLYKWTVNWRFISEDTFKSDTFAHILLAGNVLVILIFLFTRFISPKVTGKSIIQLIKDALFRPFSSTVSANNLFLDHDIGPNLIMLTLSCSNVIGVLFARSLHYQFLSWYAWQLPFLLFSTGWNFAICILVWIAHEWCWNVFPSTEKSSALLVSILTVILYSVWNNTKVWFKQEVDQVKKDQ